MTNNDDFGLQEPLEVVQCRAGLALLHEAEAFLKEDFKGTSRALRVGPEFAATCEHASVRLELLEKERPAYPSVLMLGEFKAGKSTLINALLGHKVASVDVFEMTHAVCRIVPTHEAAARVVLSTRGDETHHNRTMSLEDFLAACDARSLGPFTEATAFIPSPLKIVLIDTPGLGATLDHERDALDAVSTTDVVACVMDASNLGSGREAAVVDRIRELGLPMFVVASKTDVLAADEVSEVVKYIEETFSISADSIFPTSAKRVIDGGLDKGFLRLVEYMSGRIAPQNRTLRLRAFAAQIRDVAAELLMAMETLRSSVDETLQDVRGYEVALNKTAEAVAIDMCARLADMLRERLRLAIEDAREEFGEGAEIQEADFLRVISTALESADTRDFFTMAAADLDERFQEEWVEGVKTNIATLQAALTQIQRAASRGAQEQHLEILRREEFKKAAVDKALEAAGTAFVTCAFIGHPILSILVAAPQLAQAWRLLSQAGEQSREEAERALHAATERWRNETVSRAIGQLQPTMMELNRKIACQAAENYALSQGRWAMPIQDIAALSRLCEEWSDKLSAVAQSRTPLALPDQTGAC